MNKEWEYIWKLEIMTPLQQLLIGRAENPSRLICEPLSFEPKAHNVHIHSFTLHWWGWGWDKEAGGEGIRCRGCGGWVRWRLLGEEGASEGLHIIRTINSTLSGRLPTRAIKQWAKCTRGAICYYHIYKSALIYLEIYWPDAKQC